MSDTRIKFRALQLATEQRSSYGLRYNDFTRYRKHCANRTHRLRSTLKMTHGKGRDFKKLPPITKENIKDGHLQLLLFEAERAWAHSQDLLIQSTKPANEERASTLRRSATSRFRRSIHWATQLLSHCQSLYASDRLSASNLLEVTVYMLVLNGRLLRYKDEFDDGLIQLSVARGLLDELGTRATTSRDQALATLISDEIGPEIRYCAHELRRAKAYDIDGIVKELYPQHKNFLVENCDSILQKLQIETEAGGKDGVRKTLVPLEWDGQPVPIRNPELVDVLLKVQEAEARLFGSEGSKGVQYQQKNSSKKAVAAFDAVLLALSDAEEVARKLAEAHQSTGTSSSNSIGARDIQFVHAYIVYQLLSRRIQRDLLLVSALFSSQQRNKSAFAPTKSDHVDARLYPAVVKLLETVLQSLGQMRTLSIVDETPELASSVDARTFHTKAQRCLYLARCYAPTKKFAEAVTLIQLANLHVREARNLLSLETEDPISSSSNSFYPLADANFQNLEADLSTFGHKIKQDWFSFNGGSTAPGAEGSHQKPLFFNIALNYVELDMDRLEERAGRKEEESNDVAKMMDAVDATTAKGPASSAKNVGSPAVLEQLGEKKTMVQRTRVEEARAETPEPEELPQSRSGLSSLLGGWWSRS